MKIITLLAILLVSGLSQSQAPSCDVPSGTGYVFATDSDGNPMVWIKSGTTVECIGADAERQMLFGIGECSPNSGEPTDPQGLYLRGMVDPESR